MLIKLRKLATLSIVLGIAFGSILYSAINGNSIDGTRASGPVPSLHVSGNQLIDANNQAVVLHGVDRSGTEYACIQGWGIFDGPNDLASIQAIASWHVNSVRVPLNEDCWLDINGVNPIYGGANYQNAIINYVNLLNQNGIYAILDLHWAAPGTTKATQQMPMPDHDHSPAFWSSVATTFKNNPGVLFDIYNEPYPDNNQDTTAAWTCLLNGGICQDVSYTTAGTQELVNAVRSTGATNVIMSPGVQYTGTLTHWLNYKPTDSTGNLVASLHNYNFNSCTNQYCWDSQYGPVAASVPIVTGEIGENDCNHTYIDSLMNWMDGKNISYLAWAWNTSDCYTGPSLITSYSGSATNYGTGYKNHLANLSPIPAPSATTTPIANLTPTAFATATSVPIIKPTPTPTYGGGGGGHKHGLKTTP